MPDDHSGDHSRDLDESIDPELEALLAELDSSDLEPITPPASIWTAIERETGPADTSTPTAAGGNVVPIGARRRSVPVYLAAAAAVVLLVVGAVAVIGRDDSTNVVSATALSYDPDAFDPLGAEASATARLLERDGVYEIELADTRLPGSIGDADLELWLIEADADGAIVDVAPVALLDESGRYVVPDDIDVTTHTIVDISIEPRDGDAAHSGRSILRGVLPSA